MPNFKTLTTEESAAIEAMRDTLQEQADALQALITDGYSAATRRTLSDYTNMLGEYRPVIDKNLPGILERLKEGRCPECWGVEGVCTCGSDEDPNTPPALLQAA